MAEKNTPTVKKLSSIFSRCYDFEMHRLDIGGRGSLEGCLCFIDGLVSGNTISEDIIKPITDQGRFEKNISPEKAVQMLIDGVVYGYTVKLRDDIDKVTDDLLSGYCAVFIDGFPEACVTFETKSGDKRGIDQPKEEKVVKGAKDAFIEILKTNTMLVRRRLKNRDLKIEQVTLGDKTNTAVTILYIDKFTNPDIVNNVRKRLEAVPSEGILTSTDIEESIVDCPSRRFLSLLRRRDPISSALTLLRGEWEYCRRNSDRVSGAGHIYAVFQSSGGQGQPLCRRFFFDDYALYRSCFDAYSSGLLCCCGHVPSGDDTYKADAEHNTVETVRSVSDGHRGNRNACVF